MIGLLSIYKPSGISSYDVIRQLRRRIGREVKIGHAGTLDPLAEGVLIVCLGPATRLVELIQEYPKEYVCLACLGATSATDDAEGQIRQTPGAAAPSREAVEAAARQFVGTIDQVPPAHSAAKVAGRRAYKVARGGQVPELKPKKVTIRSLGLLEYDYPHLRLKTVCDSGTYIRSLVRDLGEVLGVGAYCRELARTAIGPFRADHATSTERLLSDPLEDLLIDPVEALPATARFNVTSEQVRRLSRGQAIRAEHLAGAADFGGLLGAVDPSGRLVGLVRFDRKGLLLPVKVFV